MKKVIATTLVVAVCFANTALANHKTAEEMWNKCDANKDGYVSKEEFMKSKSEHFAEADKNGDGKISKEEHTEMFNKMKKDMDHDHD